MKKVILGLFVAGTFLVSCGGPSPVKTVEDAVKLKEDINAAEESRLESKMDGEKELLALTEKWNKEEETLLKDYGSPKENKGMNELEKAVKLNDEKAIDVWMSYKIAEREMEKEKAKIKEGFAKSEKQLDLEWALTTTETLLGLIHNGDKKKDFEADKKKLETELDRLTKVAEATEDKKHAEFKTWYDSEFKGDKETLGKEYNPFTKSSK